MSIHRQRITGDNSVNRTPEANMDIAQDQQGPCEYLL